MEIKHCFGDLGLPNTHLRPVDLVYYKDVENILSINGFYNLKILKKKKKDTPALSFSKIKYYYGMEEVLFGCGSCTSSDYCIGELSCMVME